jgi:hypothetical protein
MRRSQIGSKPRRRNIKWQVELVMALEEEFDIEISDEDAEKIQTVQNAIDYVEANS